MFEGLTDKLQGVFRRLGIKGRLSEKNIEEGLREVRMALLEQAHALERVSRQEHVVPLLAQNVAIQVPEGLIVLDRQDPCPSEHEGRS